MKTEVDLDQRKPVRPVFRIMAWVLLVLFGLALVISVVAWFVVGFHAILLIGLPLLVLGIYVLLAVARTGYAPKYLQKYSDGDYG